MAYEMRTLATLASQARQAFTAAVTGAVVKLWANTFVVFGKVFALLDLEHEQRRAYLYRQIFASTADKVWLPRHGFELGLTQDPGNYAVGNVIVPAPNGTIIPAGLQFVRGDGLTYSTLAPVTASGASASLPLQADQPGAAGNADAGEMLTLTLTAAVPLAVGPQATVDADGLAGGTDAEDIETFRARVIYRKSNPPQGGSEPDYVEWTGKALSTVKAVFVDSFQNDSRAVWVCFTVSDQAAGLPSDEQVAIVQAYINDPVRRPVTARAFATAPTPEAVPIAITNFLPDTDDTRAAVQAELAALQADGIQPAKPTTPFVLYREEIDAAIKRAAGVGHFTLVTPSADQTFSTGGQMPVLQPPTYS